MRTAEESRQKQIDNECEVVEALITLAIKDKNNYITYWLHDGSVEELKKLSYKIEETNNKGKYIISW